MRPVNLLSTRNGRFLSFGLMYVSEGIPFGFTGTAIVAYLRGQGLGLDDIGMLVAVLFLPWSFKWAWAPLVDLFRFNAIGGRKAWIVFCTSMMCLSLLLILTLDVKENFQLLLVLLVFSNVFAATQDVAIDSLAVSTLEPNERSRGNGFMFGGQYTGIAIGGAGAIALFGLIGFEAALLMMATLLALNLLFIVLFVRDPEAGEAPRASNMGDTFRTFFRELKTGVIGSGRGPIIALVFSVLPVGAMALAYATLTTIQVDYGFTEGQISTVTAMNTIMAATGCILGGFIGDRFGLRPTLAAAYLATAVPTFVLAVAIYTLGLQGVPALMLGGLIAAYGFCFGAVFGVRAAVFMGVANPAVGATMFTTFMAMTNLTVSYTNYWQGQVAEDYGFAPVLFIDSLLVLVSVAVIPFLRERTPVAAPQAAKID